MLQNVNLQVSLSVYRDMLEFQKSLIQEFLEKSLKNSVVETQTAKAVQNIVEGTKVSIYA